MRALLDINVLVALLDSGHVHHQAASTWLDRHLEAGWASCPLTQNGCLQLLASESYPRPQPVAAVLERLREEISFTATDRPGDTIAVAALRAGELPGTGGTLCLAGDCPNCLCVVDGEGYASHMFNWKADQLRLVTKGFPGQPGWMYDAWVKDAVRGKMKYDGLGDAGARSDVLAFVLQMK